MSHFDDFLRESTSTEPGSETGLNAEELYGLYQLVRAERVPAGVGRGAVGGPRRQGCHPGIEYPIDDGAGCGGLHRVECTRPPLGRTAAVSTFRPAAGMMSTAGLRAWAGITCGSEVLPLTPRIRCSRTGRCFPVPAGTGAGPGSRTSR
jgi:hypothetical protein